MSVEDNLYAADKDDQAMNKAMEIARQRFSQFDSAWASGKYDRDKFSIKVRFPSDRGNEYIWLTEIEKKSSSFYGVVSDSPRITNAVKYGDKPAIRLNDIVDWLYGKDSLLHGGFTLRLIQSRMTKEEREQEAFPYRIED